MSSKGRLRPENGEYTDEMIKRTILTRTQESESVQREIQPSSSNSSRATIKGKSRESVVLTRTQESSEKSFAVQRKEAKPILIEQKMAK